MQPARVLRPVLALSILAMLCACGDESPGTQQRIAELEARLSAKQHEITDLQAMLQETRNHASDKTTAAPDDRSADAAAVGAAADDVARGLTDKLKPGHLSVSGQVAYAGFTLKTASGSSGVAVPFFRDGPSGTWRCGWSNEQIQSALGGAVVPSPTPMAPTPAPIASTTAPPVPTTVAPDTTATARAAGPAPVLPQGWKHDAATGQVTASDGTVVRPLQPGERYGMILGSADDTPRPIVIRRDGTPELIVR